VRSVGVRSARREGPNERFVQRFAEPDELIELETVRSEMDQPGGLTVLHDVVYPAWIVVIRRLALFFGRIRLTPPEVASYAGEFLGDPEYAA
jgi:hypothetical protein